MHETQIAIALSHPSSCGAPSASRCAFQRPLRGPWASTIHHSPRQGDGPSARARSATPAATCTRRRLLSPTRAAVAPRAPRAARFSARLATILQPLSRYCTPVAAPGRKTARQGAQRNARRNMHQTQIALMLSPTQTAAAPRAPRAARFSDRFAPLWASIVLPSPSRRIEGAPGRAAQLLAAGTTSIMAILPGFSFGNRVR